MGPNAPVRALKMSAPPRPAPTLSPPEPPTAGRPTHLPVSLTSSPHYPAFQPCANKQNALADLFETGSSFGPYRNFVAGRSRDVRVTNEVSLV